MLQQGAGLIEAAASLAVGHLGGHHAKPTAAGSAELPPPMTTDQNTERLSSWIVLSKSSSSLSASATALSGATPGAMPSTMSLAALTSRRVLAPSSSPEPLRLRVIRPNLI